MPSRTETPPSPQISCKYQWARQVARNRLEEDFNILNEKVSAEQGAGLAKDVAELLGRTQGSKLTGDAPDSAGKFKVGIIGAGCSGLFTAMILDHLREKIKGIDIDYEILEAAGEERLGAMRFPDGKNKIMERTFRLFNLLGISEENDNLVPYYFKDEDNVCPSYYNDIRKVSTVEKENDPYELNIGLPDDDKIRPDLINHDPSTIMDTVLKPYADQVKQHLEGAEETVLESLDFDKEAQWYCVYGGTQQVATKMVEQLRNTPEYNHKVTAITRKPGGIMSLTIKQGDALTSDTRDYFAVFNSTTLGALQRMDLTKAGLHYGAKQAIRSLR
ncbi:hypothetical protein GTA08_BOTSDO08325 [Botryosphaeria dothidea]|uniref:Amine oxidase domain-containing protein n=1 Tax=Botryosphaeria dothidea TaxID=55169 RepID=A0A8H4N5M9_9PEZI|nr:hypothetical protein GTA08_BOTSDO08325 [Botryosphaeria dothidea]